MQASMSMQAVKCQITPSLHLRSAFSDSKLTTSRFCMRDSSAATNAFCGLRLGSATMGAELTRARYASDGKFMSATKFRSLRTQAAGIASVCYWK